MKMDMLRFVGATPVDFPLLGADESGPFVLKGADGLGPPEVTVRMPRTVLEKANYQGKSVALRQIVALVGLQPDWDTGQTADELRTILYGLLTPRYNQMVRAEIVSEGVVQGFAQGHISRMEAALFSKDIAVQITLDCDYGYFLDPEIQTQVPPQRNIGIGGFRAFDISNLGTAPAGFKMGVILRDVPFGGNLVLTDPVAGGQWFGTTGMQWKAGDRFVIDTRPGTRGVWRSAAPTTTGGPPGPLVSILNNINASQSEWIQLYGGDNTLMLGVNAFDWDPDYNFSHQPAFWGV